MKKTQHAFNTEMIFFMLLELTVDALLLILKPNFLGLDIFHLSYLPFFCKINL